MKHLRLVIAALLVIVVTAPAFAMVPRAVFNELLAATW